jgi:hypothetical protein
MKISRTPLIHDVAAGVVRPAYGFELAKARNVLSDDAGNQLEAGEDGGVYASGFVTGKELQEALAGVGDSAELTEAVGELQEALETKADASAMTTALAGKADASAMTTALAAKADASALAGKADASAMTTALAGKADSPLPVASDTARGVVELATSAEVLEGVDSARAVTPAGLKGALDAAAVTVKRGDVDTSAAIAVNDAVTVPQYIVGSNRLQLFFMGLLCQSGADESYVEVGIDNQTSTSIQILFPVPAGSRLVYIIYN